MNLATTVTSDQEMTQVVLLVLQIIKLIHDMYMHRTLQDNHVILERNHYRIKELYSNAACSFPCNNRNVNNENQGDENG